MRPFPLFLHKQQHPIQIPPIFNTQTLHNIHYAAAMKKLYRKGTVHPTPPLVSDQLAFLPAAILTLAAALCQEDKEVLAYLISCSSANFRANRKTSSGGAAAANHPPCFNCNCFSCYMSYWVRWDSSPNRQLIHEIIDAYEDELQLQSKKKLEKNKREKRRNKTNNNGNKGSAGELKTTKSEASLNNAGESNDSGSAEHSRANGGDDSKGEEEDGGERGAVRRIVSFLGERIWTTIWT